MRFFAFLTALLLFGLICSFVAFVFLAVYTPGNDVWGDMAVAAALLFCPVGWFAAEVFGE